MMDESRGQFDGLQRLPPERRWRQQRGPVFVVVTLIQRPDPAREEDKFLLIRRRQAPYARRWALVGGKLEFGETLAMAATREVLEETGLEAEFVALRGVVNERLAPSSPQARAGHFLLFVCAVDAAHGEPQEQFEGELAWFTLPEMEQLGREGAIIPSDHRIIKQFGPSRRALPFYEAEMVAAEGLGESSPLPRLLRFERSS